MNGNISWMYYMKLTFSEEKLYTNLGNFKFFLFVVRLSWSLEIVRFIEIVKSDTNKIFGITFKFLCIFWDAHSLKNNSGVRRSSGLLKMVKKLPWCMLSFFLKSKLPLWNINKRMYCYQSLRWNTKFITKYYGSKCGVYNTNTKI